ncbi:hypothetical protein TRM7557_01949 [Tritonibacter multivorans]|uniref:Uncharacterized protein n=1 Tax=Tritonibacter multivorans TaxID=928856 RepID=A0A0P1GAY2_9RHOB|nr:hypothetical protein [Tritonibacter multivorans]MDA7422048.1 hypothetical protein [Tritonibacter multivorans]CUH78571.1 hypothetical protein TRM7557_01949 [Tritonibacter multivorans]SFD18633.1 hypothetical protein SAMN04488049_108120 [Tritonibacter multivorans]
MLTRPEPRQTVQRLGVTPGLGQQDFRCVAKGGFGDGVNAYAHSMAWFKNHLYVGTTRGNFALMRRRLPIGMDPWPVECPKNPFDLGLNSEIWRYDVVSDDWQCVRKAPTVTGSHGRKIPSSFGHRSMLVHEDALYCTTWSPAAGKGPEILRSENGLDWHSTCEPGLHGLPVTAIRTMVAFKGKVYTTPSGSRGGNPNVASHSIVYESDDIAGGEWVATSEFGFGDAENKTVFEMVGFGEHLYVGTFNLAGYEIWRSDLTGPKPYKWEKVITQGAWRGPENQIACSLIPFKGALYVGGGIQGGGVDTQNKVGPAASELIRINQDGTWDLIVGKARQTPDGWKEPLSGWTEGFDNWFAGYFWRMGVHDGWLYVSTYDWSGTLPFARRDPWPQMACDMLNRLPENFIPDYCGGCGVYRSFDGENWMEVTSDGLGNPYNIGIRNIVSTPHGLFLGTANPFGPRLWSFQDEAYLPHPNGGCEVHLGNLTPSTSSVRS